MHPILEFWFNCFGQLQPFQSWIYIYKVCVCNFYIFHGIHIKFDRFSSYDVCTWFCIFFWLFLAQLQPVWIFDQGILYRQLLQPFIKAFEILHIFFPVIWFVIFSSASFDSSHFTYIDLASTLIWMFLSKFHGIQPRPWGWFFWNCVDIFLWCVIVFW